MNAPFYAYLDDFNLITIIISKDLYMRGETFSLKGNDEVIKLNVLEDIPLQGEEKLLLTFDAYIDLSTIYYVFSERGFKAELFDGKIVRTPLFDSIYNYHKNDLGVTYKKESSKFKIWSPIAKKVTLELKDNEDNIRFIDLVYKNQGVWRLELFEDLEGYKYRYHVYLNGKEKITLDPYAISSDANSNYNYIIDKDKLYKMTYKKSNRPHNKLKSVIYETSFKDFTSFFKEDPNRSTYTKLYDKNLKGKHTKFGLPYLKKLGVTHIELMPFYSFDGVDENDRFKSYNWGYNPREYNVPSGLYSINPNDPYERINELKKAIDEIHKAGLNVIMDVVYNHVFDPEKFPFEILCPGYFYIYNYEGMRTAFSGCKNDVNSSKKMVRKFINDSIHYWLEEFHIDGFRFDLMGLIDLETMNMISQDLEYIDPNILVFGEGWKMINNNTADSMTHMYNRNVVKQIGFFNDKTRESIRRYALGYNDSIDDLRYTLLGSNIDRYLFKYASQSINYTECHDDMTYYDIIRQVLPEIDEEEAKKRATLALSMTILSLGIPFIHAGQEAYDSKNFCRNSYNTSDEMNMLRWDNIDKEYKNVEFISKVIKFRNENEVFLYNSETEIKENVKLYSIYENTLMYSLNNENEEVLVIFKNNDNEIELDLSGYEIELSNLEYSDNIIKGIGLIVLRRENGSKN